METKLLISDFWLDWYYIGEEGLRPHYFLFDRIPNSCKHDEQEGQNPELMQA
jgi:hypothetical protein